MARAPFQVLVIPFFRHESDARFGLLRRADAGYWQWIAGGGEDDETPVQAAHREVREETGLRGELCGLSMMAFIPVSHFAVGAVWPDDLYVIPEYAFALSTCARAHAPEVTLSAEHTEVRWVSYADAMALLQWQSNASALWELNERLRRGDLHPIAPSGFDGRAAWSRAGAGPEGRARCPAVRSGCPGAGR